MQKNSPIKERILQYLDYKGISQYEFYKKTGVSRGTLANSSGLSEDNTAKFFEYAKDVNAEWLFLGKGEMLQKNKAESVKQEKTPEVLQEKPYIYNQTPQVVTVNESTGNENITLVPVKAAAGYLAGFGDPEFIETLPAFNLPMLTNGTFRMFEVAGHSMYNTLHDGSYVIGEFCENWIEDIKDNQVYIIVSPEEGVIVKRVLNRIKKYGSIYVKSDNRREYPSYAVNIDNVLEVWKVKTALIYELPDPATIYDRINDLEAEVLNLRQNTAAHTRQKP